MLLLYLADNKISKSNIVKIAKIAYRFFLPLVSLSYAAKATITAAVLFNGLINMGRLKVRPQNVIK